MASQLQLSLKDLRFKYLECLTYTSAILNHTEYEDPLPYTPIEYIESTGTQYINTGYKYTTDTRFVLKASHFVDNEVNPCVLHCGSSWNSSGNTMSISGGNLYWSYTDNNVILSNVYNITTKTTIDILQDTIKVNGTVIKSSTTINSNTNQYQEIRLFASRDLSHKGAYRLYEFLIYAGTTLKHQFIPVIRKSDSVVCLYDLVTEQFFVNAGTGVFVAGGEI